MCSRVSGGAPLAQTSQSLLKQSRSGLTRLAAGKAGEGSPRQARVPPRLHTEIPGDIIMSWRQRLAWGPPGSAALARPTPMAADRGMRQRQIQRLLASLSNLTSNCTARLPGLPVLLRCATSLPGLLASWKTSPIGLFHLRNLFFERHHVPAILQFLIS